jgi:hypothetical protein
MIMNFLLPCKKNPIITMQMELLEILRVHQNETQISNGLIKFLMQREKKLK